MYRHAAGPADDSADLSFETVLNVLRAPQTTQQLIDRLAHVREKKISPIATVTVTAA